MLFVVHTISVLAISFYLHIASLERCRPNFVPYCNVEEKCISVCTCDFFPNCSLLPMDENVRESILFHHNQLREIQTGAEPTPAGMAVLQYDFQLEEVSKCWAARCDNEFSSCFITPQFPETSQSVLKLVLEDGKEPSDFSWIQILNYWLNQVKSVSVQSIDRYPDGEAGERLHNYAQLLSDKILFVGCAWSMLKDAMTFVCTYAPRGPIRGEAIYKVGKSCSSCPLGYRCIDTNPFRKLCKKVISVVKTKKPSLKISTHSQQHSTIETKPLHVQYNSETTQSLLISSSDVPLPLSRHHLKSIVPISSLPMPNLYQPLQPSRYSLKPTLSRIPFGTASSSRRRLTLKHSSLIFGRNSLAGTASLRINAHVVSTHRSLVGLGKQLPLLRKQKVQGEILAHHSSKNSQSPYKSDSHPSDYPYTPYQHLSISNLLPTLTLYTSPEHSPQSYRPKNKEIQCTFFPPMTTPPNFQLYSSSSSFHDLLYEYIHSTTPHIHHSRPIPYREIIRYPIDLKVFSMEQTPAR
ncbi:hypothetical protein HHI36_012443 [Cryptolaemus montrouzieri]|uniref:SCP domain-containing protein n=1 Tax=Cryptolaemus montrouzieri TaxID=559131 RepID=A0ABD2NF25_9CUCU